MQLRDYLSMCLVLTLTLSIADAEDRRNLRRFLYSYSSSHPPDRFENHVPAMRGPNKTPHRSTRIPMDTIGFKTARSEQQFTSDASPEMRPWLDTSDERDYPEIGDYDMDWVRNQDYEEGADNVIGSRPLESLGSHIPDNSIRSNLPREQYQRERNFIPLRDTRFRPDTDPMRNYPNILCRCETNLGGIYVSKSNEIQTGSTHSYQGPSHPENSAYGQRHIHQKSESRPPHYQIRSKPAGMNRRENHLNFHGSTFEETHASKLNKPTIRIKFTTEIPKSTTDGSQPSAVIRVLT